MSAMFAKQRGRLKGSGLVLPCIAGVLAFSLNLWWFSSTSENASLVNLDGTEGNNIQLADVENPCGPTCVSLMSRILGNPLSLEEVAQLVSPDALGRISFADILTALRSSGFHAVALHFSAAKIPKLRVPAILHWQSSHYVVSVSDEYGHVLILDPPYEPSELSSSQIAQRYSGSAILVHSDRETLINEMIRMGIEARSADLFDNRASEP